MRRIQIEIEFEHVDPWLAEKSELPLLGVFCYERADFVFSHSALPRHPRDLKFRRCRRNVRVEP